MTRFPREPALRSTRTADGRRIIKRNGRIVLAAPVRPEFDWLACSSRSARRVSGLLARGLRSRAFSGSLAALPLFAGATVARAQAVAPLVPMSLDPVFNRNRNVSVAEQYDPAYQPLGVRMGSVLVYPSLGITTGATDNVYTTNAFKRSDAFYFLQPVLNVTTDFPKHKIDLLASGDIQRYAHEDLRNQNNYSLMAQGRLDLGRELQITARMQYSKASESPYASDLGTDVSVLSIVTRANPSVQAVYSAGRTRLTARAERIDFDFNDIRFADGSFRNQSERNRTIDRAVGQAEYAVSPSVAAFMQGTYEVTDYKDALRSDGRPNRDSKAYTVLAGINFDLAGLMRGSIGGGYSSRNFDASFYRTNSAFILQIQAEYFLSPLTTIGIGAQRTIQDSSSPFNGAYSDTRASLNVDHALLRNLILTANLTRVNQELLDTKATSRLTTTSFSARYQSNRFISISGAVQYGRGRPGELPLGIKFDELRGLVTLRVRR